MAVGALQNGRANAGSGARRTLGPGIVLAAIAAAMAVNAARPLPGPVTREQAVADSLRLTLVAPDTVRAGAPVRLTLRLTNLTDRPVEAHFLGRVITFDIVVAREDGTVVWRRLAHAVVPGILQVRMLAPHETLELNDVWRQRGDDGKPVTTGTYAVWGVLPSDEREPRRTPAATLHIS